MKLANFFATHREQIRNARKSAVVGFATGCAFHSLRNDAPLGRTLLYCTLLAVFAYIILFCIDRAIGIMSPLIIDLNKVKGISKCVDNYRLHIENEAFYIKAYIDQANHIDSFQLFEKEDEKAVKLETIYTAWTGENCILRVNDADYKLDGGLAKHLLAILNCHAEANHACQGLSFIA